MLSFFSRSNRSRPSTTSLRCESLDGRNLPSVVVPMAPNTEVAIQSKGVDDDRFVHHLYEDVLHRVADDSGLQHWDDDLTSGRHGRDDIAAEFVHSDEADDSLVRSLYTNILGRSADAGGLSYWKGQLNSGKSSDDVKAAIYNSQEYFNKVGQSNANYVESLYTSLLGRASDTGGKNYWVSLLNQGVSRGEVAKQILHSRENDIRDVQEVYTSLLGRTADDNGREAFVGYMQGGGKIEDVKIMILSSTEYYNRV